MTNTDCIKIGGLREANAKLRRERDALQQQVYDLAARNVHLENEISVHREESLEIIHDLHVQLERARALRRG
jgi:FtsZ-binding cell division protein ZapB